MIKHSYELETILDFAEEWIKGIVQNEKSNDVEDALSVSKARQLFFEYLLENLEIKE